MRKQIATGFIAGLVLTFGLLFTAKGVYAATKIAQQVNYPILIDNVIWTPSTPALNVEGSTYLPLRAMSEALGVQIDWSKEYRRVDVYKNKKPGDFPIGDGSVQTGITMYDYLKNNYKNSINLLGVNEGGLQEDDDVLEIIYLVNYNSSDKSYAGNIRFNLTNMIYKHYEGTDASWVKFDKNFNPTEVTVSGNVIIDPSNPKYVNLVNEFKKNMDVLQNQVLKTNKLSNYLGLKVSELKSKNY